MTKLLLTDEEALAQFNVRIRKPEHIEITGPTVNLKKKKKPRQLSPETRANQKKAQRKIRAELAGLTLEEADRRWEGHPKLCEICGDPPPENYRLNMDHNHTTGKFRGWLCGRCNAGLGMFRDNIILLAKAIEYISSDTVNEIP